MTRRRNSNDGVLTQRGQILPLSYNTAFKILGPTPRVERRAPAAPRGFVKYPDAVVLEIRKLERYHSASQIAAMLSTQDMPLRADWVAAVMDGRIRGKIQLPTERKS